MLFKNFDYFLRIPISSSPAARTKDHKSQDLYSIAIIDRASMHEYYS